MVTTFFKWLITRVDCNIFSVSATKLLKITECCWILSHFFEVCQIMLNFVNFVKCCQILLDFLILSILSNFVEFCWIVLHNVGFCQTLLNNVKYCWILSKMLWSTLGGTKSDRNLHLKYSGSESAYVNPFDVEVNL